MFEDYSIADFLITFFILYVVLKVIAFAQDPELQELKSRLASLEQVECIVEEINGQFYLWMVIPEEGCRFVGQGASKEYLADIGQKFLRRKYGVDN